MHADDAALSGIKKRLTGELIVYLLPAQGFVDVTSKRGGRGSTGDGGGREDGGRTLRTPLPPLRKLPDRLVNRGMHHTAEVGGGVRIT